MPLPVDLPPQEADQIGKHSLAFAHYYYPDASHIPDVRIACVAGCCEVSVPILCIMLELSAALQHPITLAVAHNGLFSLALNHQILRTVASYATIASLT